MRLALERGGAIRSSLTVDGTWRDAWVKRLVNANRARAARLRFSAPPS